MDNDFSQEVKYLDRIQGLLTKGQVTIGITDLVRHLYNLNTKVNTQEFKSFVRHVALPHPIRALIHQDPYAFRSFSKPRGYPGDAELLDFFYGFNGPKENATELGCKIFRVSMARPASESIRYRATLLGNIIDEVALRHSNARILSIACGHLREGFLSKAVQSKTIGALIGIDQDAASIGFIEREKGSLPIETHICSIRSILTKKKCFNDLDFVYTAGLIDYLQAPLARRLTSIMFDMLKTGGRLCISNASPTTEEKGYMETFMDWHLYYRDEIEVSSFVEEIDQDEIVNRRLYQDPNKNIIYLELFKK